MIYDTGDTPLLSATLGLQSLEAQTLTVNIDCESGYSLSCGPADGLTVEARRGASGLWTDIVASSIDLSTWAGSVQTFQIRLTADAVSSYSRRALTITVGR